jgi:hypothetical protein
VRPIKRRTDRPAKRSFNNGKLPFSSSFFKRIPQSRESPRAPLDWALNLLYLGGAGMERLQDGGALLHRAFSPWGRSANEGPTALALRQKIRSPKSQDGAGPTESRQIS